MELKKVGAQRPPQKKKRAHTLQQNAKRPKLRSLIRDEDFCLNPNCNKRIPTAILFALRAERPGEKRYYCPDCAKEIARGKPAFR